MLLAFVEQTHWHILVCIIFLATREYLYIGPSLHVLARHWYKLLTVRRYSTGPKAQLVYYATSAEQEYLLEQCVDIFACIMLLTTSERPP